MKTSKKRGIAKGSTIKFYTQQEVEIIEEAVKNGKKTKDNLSMLSKKLKRPLSGIYPKYLAVKKNLGLNRKKNKAGIATRMEAIQFPKNVLLEFPAKKVVITDDRITVFFN